MSPPRPTSTARNRLLRSLPQADSALLEPHLKDVALRARELLHEAQDDIQHVHFPHGGMISIFAVTDDGEAIETASVGSEGAVGAMAGLGLRRALGRAVVQIPGIAARISAAQLQKAARDSDRVRDMIVRSNEVQMVQAHHTAACYTLHDVTARLARWLLQAQDRSDGGAIRLIQEYMAQALGVRRTTINLVVRNLQDAGLIRYRRGQVEILDRNALMSQSCSCYRVIRRQIDHILPVGQSSR